MKKLLLLILSAFSTVVQAQVNNDIDKDLQYKITVANNYKALTFISVSVSAISMVSSFIAYDKISEREVKMPANITEAAVNNALRVQSENISKAQNARTALLCVSGATAIATVGLLIKYINLKQEITLKKATIQTGIMDSGNVGLAINF